MVNVGAVFKNGNKDNPGKYRPVSLTCISCKLLEHIILSNISPILGKFLCQEQHGFQKASLALCNEIMEVVDKEISVFDFSKAFD